eukprot:TRINITY_DN68367_c0_g1_i1.p1 TRINITY_DN68367_c0_g1~~TRINITY_DN68367_c0_g1_i1.p1  ORF type:complete len:401 (-),score=56.79 TRINITY_DN68367_c0_g1_i1:23-1225(-)
MSRAGTRPRAPPRVPYYDRLCESRATRARPSSAAVASCAKYNTVASVRATGRLSPQPTSGSSPRGSPPTHLPSHPELFWSVRDSVPHDDTELRGDRPASARVRRVCGETLERLAAPRSGPSPQQRALPSDMSFKPKICSLWGDDKRFLDEVYAAMTKHEMADLPESDSKRGTCEHENDGYYCITCNSTFCESCWTSTCLAAKLKWETSSLETKISLASQTGILADWQCNALLRCMQPPGERLYRRAVAKRNQEQTAAQVKSGPSRSKKEQQAAVEALARPRLAKEFPEIPYLPAKVASPKPEDFEGLINRHDIDTGSRFEAPSGLCDECRTEFFDVWRCRHCTKIFCGRCISKKCKVVQCLWDGLNLSQKLNICVARKLMQPWQARVLARSEIPVHYRIA